MAPANTRLFVLGWIAVAGLFILAWLLFQRGIAGVREVGAPGAIGSAAVGRPLPDETLLGLDGSSSSLRKYVGRPFWVNFFATWCPPCKAEFPEIERHYEARKSEGLVVLGVDEQERPAQVIAFAKRYGTKFPMVIDPGAAAVAFSIQTIPVSVFVDAGGVVRFIRVGQMDANAMNAALEKILPAR